MKYVILAPVALLIWGAILFPVISSLYGIFRWQGAWRTASVIPLVVLLLFSPILLGDYAWRMFAYIPLTMLLSAYSGVVVLLHRKRSHS